MSYIKLGNQKQKLDKTTSACQLSESALKKIAETGSFNKIKAKAKEELQRRSNKKAKTKVKAKA